MRRLLCLLTLLLMDAALMAQQARQYSFTHLSTPDGLVSGHVNNVVQDEEGYMWIASGNGLQRYDGNTFLTFRTSTQRSIPFDNVARIYLDRHNKLWLIFANNQVGSFDTKTFTYTDRSLPDQHSGKAFRPKYFFETPEGVLILHENLGSFFYYDAKASRFLPADKILPLRKARYERIVWDPTIRKYWLAGETGLALFDPATRQTYDRDHNPGRVPAIIRAAADSTIYGLTVDRQGNLIFCSWPYGSGAPSLHKYEKATGAYTKQYLNGIMNNAYLEILGMLEQQNGRFWIFGHPFLVEWAANKTGFKKIPNEYRNEQSLKFDYLRTAYEDRERNIWLCTDNGLFVFNPDAQHFNAYNMMRPGGSTSIEAPVETILETEDRFYVATWGNGLYLYDKAFNPLPLPRSLQGHQESHSYWDLARHSPTGRIWMGLQSGVIIVHDPVTEQTVRHQPPIFEQRTIRQVVEDRQGNLWFGTQYGKLVHWDYQAAGGDPLRGYTVVRNTGLIHKLHRDEEGYIWVATHSFGLYKYDPVRKEVVDSFSSNGPKERQLSSDIIMDIIGYGKDSLIVLTDCINILSTKTGRVRQINTRNGLPSNSTYSGVMDRNGILWIGMMNGLCRVNLKRNIFITYDRRDGIPYDNFTTASAGNLLSDGRVAFATGHNLLVFDPARLLQANTPFRPVITSVTAGDRNLLVDSLQRSGKLELSYTNNSLTIGFSALSYLKQKKLHYFYRLEGLQEDWQHTENATQAVYNYLPPGTYTFRVRSGNVDGVMSEEVQSFSIVVGKPFWRSWWFYGLVALLIVTALLLIDRERMKRLRDLQRMRSEIAGNLHQEINTTLSNISILSEMARMKADKDLARSKEYIQQISEKSHNMIIAMDDILWSIAPENDTMEETLLRLREFIDALQNRHEARILLAIDEKVRALRLDMKKRHEVFLLLKNALRLVVEDNYGRDTQINIDQVRARLLVKIRDNTVLTSLLSAGMNKRVDEMRARARSIEAELDVQTDSRGMAVIILMPL